MRFPYSFTLETSSRSAKLRLASRNRIHAQRGQSLSSIPSRHPIPFPTAPSAHARKCLTEIPFEHNFCKLGLESR
jgi:hypothetical protein